MNGEGEKTLKEKMDEYIKKMDITNYYITIIENADKLELYKLENRLNSIIFNLCNRHKSDTLNILLNVDFDITNKKLEEEKEKKKLENTFLQLHYALYHLHLYNSEETIKYLELSIESDSNNHFSKYFLGLLENSPYLLASAGFNGNVFSAYDYCKYLDTYDKDDIHKCYFIHIRELYQKVNKINQIIAEFDNIKKSIQDLRTEMEYLPVYGKKYLEAKEDFDSKKK